MSDMMRHENDLHGEELKHDERTVPESTTNGEKKEKREQKEKAERVPYHRLFLFADSTDIILMVVGTIGAIGNGLGMPLMSFLFGQLIDSFGNNQFSPNVVKEVSKVKSLNQLNLVMYYYYSYR